jgi:HAD superfamily hydrolase (TIGR01490 family)
VLPATIRFAFDRDRAALKQSLLRATLRGTPRAELHAAAAAFVTDTIARRCFADALAAIRRHHGAGHHMVLMSASVDFYVPEFGRQLGFDQVISTGVAWNGDLLDGTLTTPNRRGEEKAIRLRELVAERKDGETFAYGNSDSDLPHLRIARHGLLVNGSLAARRDAAAMGVPTADWT